MGLLVVVLFACANSAWGQGYVQKHIGLMPGFYQRKTDQKSMGLVFAAMQVGILSGGLYYLI